MSDNGSSRLPGLLGKLGKMTSIRDTEVLEQSLLRTLGPLLGVLDTSLYRTDDQQNMVRVLNYHRSKVIEADGVARMVERVEEVSRLSDLPQEVLALTDNIRLLGKPCTRKIGKDLLVGYPLLGFGGRKTADVVFGGVRFAFAVGLVLAAQGLDRAPVVREGDVLAEVQQRGRGGGELADGPDAERRELRLGLRPDAVDPPYRQRPDPRLEIAVLDDREPVGLVHVGGELGELLVRRDADRAGQAGRRPDRRLQPAPEHRAAFELDTGDVAEIEVDLVDAAVLHHRGDLDHGGLESARHRTVAIEVGGQEHAIRAELAGAAQCHARTNAEAARRIVGGGDDAAGGRVAGPADGDRPVGKLRSRQQLDRRIEGVHVEVGDAAVGVGQARILETGRPCSTDRTGAGLAG